MKVIKLLKDKDLDILILIIAISIRPALFRMLYVNDELWNFAFIYKIGIGYIPYEELNIIVTPLFHMIDLLFLKILGMNFFAFRIYNLIMLSIIFFLIFKIFKNLKIDKKTNVIILLLTYFFFLCRFENGASYNTLAYIPILTSVILLIKHNKNYVIHGILILLSFLTKQTIGMYFGIGIILYILINKKNIVKNFLKVGIVNFLGILIFAIVLYKIGILADFYYYTFEGINEFALNNLYINFDLVVIISIIIINISLIYFIEKSEIKEKDKIMHNVKILFCIGTPLILVGYPILNIGHIVLATLIKLIEFIYIIYTIFLKDILRDRILKNTIIVLFLLIIIFNFMSIIVLNRLAAIHTEKDPYYGVLMYEEMIEKIKNICQFVKENDKQGTNTIILSQQANLYMVPLNRNNKYGMDLPNKGNLGRNGEENLIKRIGELENTFILIVTNEEDMLWQESKTVREYIQKKLDKIGTIECFDIYYKK